MSVNSSAISTDSLPHPNHSSSDSYLYSVIQCYFTNQASMIFIPFSITNTLLLLPLCILVLYVGLQRWRQEHSTSTVVMARHSDSFTYHVVIIELFGQLASILTCCAIYTADAGIMMAGFHLWSFTYYGETFFHMLTCLERYLAVVHPIIYLGLRGARGIRIRNVTIGCVWLSTFAAASLLTLDKVPVVIDFSLLFVSLIVISFCSLSVLLVLIRPGPGEQGGDRGRVDQSKKRAFYTIVAILGVLLFRVFCDLVWLVLEALFSGSMCTLTIIDFWCNLPSSLVLPLLFLLRAGKLACCKNNTEYG